ncbi:MAG TPA: lipid kinase [Alphaproteobacteria bacterium]|jgi:YegS/Rv2252/BmrU family lipid kinase|nr:lipid kinase [Alphaproteobacteria bacterium]
MAKRALLLVNRLSRSGDADLSAAVGCLRAAGLDVTPFATERPQDIPTLIRAHRCRVDLVIVGGGDGSMNAAAAAVLEIGVPMAVLPLGTANDLARTLGIPSALEEACAVAANGLRHRIDLGEVNGKHFFNVASIGLSVAVARMIDAETKRRWGAAGYALTVVKALREHRPFRVRIRCDGRFLQLRSIQIAVGNGRHYGGGLTVASDAAIDDYMLDLYSIGPAGLLRLALLAPALRTGRHGEFEGVHLLRGRHIELETSRPMPVNTDGEVTTHTPAVFRTLPGALEMMVPAAFVEASGEADAAE